MRNKILTIILLSLLFFVGWQGSRSMWKVRNNILSPVNNNWKVNIGASGLSTDTVNITSGDTASAYMKSDTLKLNPVKGSGYFDLRLWTLLLKDGDYYFGSILPADSISRIGKSDSAFATGYYKYLHAESLRTTDNTFLGDSGKTTTIGKDGDIIMPSANSLDTLEISPYKIWNKNNILYLGAKGIINITLKGTYMTFGVPLYPDGDNTKDIGASGFYVHNFYIAGSIVDSTGMISGSGTFPATYTCDTFLLSGVSSTDVIQVDWYGATQYNYGLRVTYTTDTIFIYCDVSDTTKARAEGFTYMRTAHKP